MPLTTEDLSDIFSYHKPEPLDLVCYEEIRSAALEFAETILRHTPTSADQTVAIRKVREAVMIANAAIALRGKY